MSHADHADHAGHALVRAMEAHGVSRVFCVPGESYLPVLDALHDSSIATVVCRHEGGASYMAEATGRFTGSPGVAMVTRGPGAANALVGVHAAWQHAVPMILLVGLVPRGERFTEAFQDFDLTAWFGSTAKMVTVVDDPARIGHEFARAHHCALSGRRGPVVIGLPEDMLFEAAAGGPVRPLGRADAAIPPRQSRRIAELLDAATSPVVVAGGSDWDAEAARLLERWAVRHGIPVLADFRRHDLVDNTSPVYAGHLGFGRPEAAARLLDGADLVLLLGCVLDDVALDGGALLRHDGATVVAVGTDPDLLGHLRRVDLHVAGSPRELVAQLPEPGCLRSPSALDTAHRAWLDFGSPPAPCPHPGVDLGRLVGDLDRLLPADAIITYGAGNYALWAQRHLRHRTFPSLLAPRNGTMGYGIPAAVAAQLAAPERTVVSFAGDGCFLMNGQELATAVQYGLSPLILVVDNGQYGTIRSHQEVRFPGRRSGTVLENPSFAAMAEAFGGFGTTVSDDADAGAALRAALAFQGPAVIHLRTCAENCLPATEPAS